MTYFMDSKVGGKAVAKVFSEESRNYSGDSGPESKASKAMLKGMDSMSFDVWKFAVPIVTAPLVLRRRFLDIVLGVLDMWVVSYENGNYYDDDEHEFLIDAKRIHEALKKYR